MRAELLLLTHAAVYDWPSFNHIQFAFNLRGKYYDVVYVPHEHTHTHTNRRTQSHVQRTREYNVNDSVVLSGADLPLSLFFSPTKCLTHVVV